MKTEAQPLATADRQKLEGYLAWKWGLQANLPAGHPFQNGPPLTNGQAGPPTMVIPP